MLHVTERSYSEEYKRFYFRDVQSISLYGTARRAIWNVALSVLMMSLFLLLRTIASITVAGISALVVFGVPLIINTVRGTACRVFLKTMVQTEELSSLDRIARAQRVLDRVRPLISAAQGQLNAQDLEQRVKDFRTLRDVRPSAEPGPFAQSPLNLSGMDKPVAPQAPQGTE